jgi:hypothetical protein
MDTLLLQLMSRGHSRKDLVRYTQLPERTELNPLSKSGKALIKRAIELRGLSLFSILREFAQKSRTLIARVLGVR